MSERDQMLAVMAELGALRAVVSHAIALRLLEEPDPSMAMRAVGAQLAARPTQPPGGDTGLDPAISDLLAGLTDERIAAFCADTLDRLERLRAA